MPAKLEESKKALAALVGLCIDIIALVRGGIGLQSIGKILSLIGDVKELISDAPHVLPELQHLDSSDAAELGAAAYQGVLQVIKACRGLA